MPLRGVGQDAIASIALGAIARLVRTLEGEFGRVLGEFECGNADACRDFQRADPLASIERRRCNAWRKRSP